MPAARIALWVATAGAAALLVRSLWLGPLPLWLSVLALCAYVALIVWGVLWARFGMFADVVTHGSSGTNHVALTFDDGPDPKTTREVMAILAEHDIQATFFLIGEKAERYPEVVRELVEAGHELGVHGYQHDRLYAFKTPAAVQADIAKTQDVLERIAGVRPPWFRPPLGQISPRTALGARRAQLPVVLWSVRGRDGLKSARSDAVLNRVKRGLLPGAIVLLHDAAERQDFEPASLKVLPQICRTLRERGLVGVGVGELVAGETPGLVDVA